MFRKRWRVIIPMGGVFILAALPSFAQQYPTPEATGLNYSITAGVAFLVGKNIENNTTVTAGVSWYDVASDEMGTNAALGITGDWVLVKRLDQNVSVIPLMLSYRRYGIIGGYRVFVNFGLGVLGATAAIPEMRLSSGANFGWSGGLGVDVSNNLYFHARFIGGQYPSDDGMTTVQLGYRF